MTRLIDLTHYIEAGMPVFPGTEAPLLHEANTIEKHGFAEKKITMYSHTGTHMDAPAHMEPGAKTLDAYAVDDFFGPAVLVDVRGCGEYIGLERLKPYEARLKGAKFLILRTGWEERWGRPDFYEGFPALTPEAAHWLVKLGLRGLGSDAISADRMQDAHFPIHHILFPAGMFMVENLANLAQLGEQFTFGVFPLRIKDADGSPVRAVAFVEE